MIRIARTAGLSIVTASAFVSGAFLLACVSSTNVPSTPGGDDAGTGGDSAASPGVDGASGGGDGASGSGKVARISVSQQVTGATVLYSVGAGFGLAQQQGASTCTTQAFGPCAAVRCPMSDAGSPTTTSESAGTITVTGAGSSSAVLTFDAATGRYTPVQGKTAFFKGGDTITAVGAGAAVPAFAAQTVIAPSDVVFTAPACASTACPDLDRTKDMAVAWTGGGAGNVEIAIETTSDVLSTSVLCTFKASAAAGTIPAAAMAMLDKADGVAVTAVEIMFPIAQTTFAVGSYPQVSFTVQGSGAEGFAKMAN